MINSKKSCSYPINRKQFKLEFAMKYMGEELLQRDLLKNPKKMGDWNFYNIGSTSIKTLKEHGIIRNVSYGDIEKKKVDGIIIEGNRVIAIIENKKPSEFRTKKQKEKAIKQELKVAEKLTKLLIVTDTKETLWVNSLNGQIIKDEKGKPIKDIFNPENHETIELIKKINNVISEENSILKPVELINPTKLASQVWQDIWMVSGATPENCLYTFVELFIFKYLSDLGVLKGSFNFDKLVEMYEDNSDEDVLEQYAKVIRPKIKDLFKENPIDKTTIINGTIFVSKDQKAVSGYSTVFKRVLFRFRDYKRLDNIDRDFKSRLFESFMKESISKKNWGQFFTPLKVVKAIVKMADVKEGDKVCDPACGVGKFPLETIATNPERFFKINNKGELIQKVTLRGYDKGFDTEEQKTIILAKANMLIYLSDLIKKYPNIPEQFSKLFNESFTLKTNSILGTLAEEVENEYDWILTNPPYVTTGSSNLKEEIVKSGLENHYKINAMGVEGLFMEWIIRALKPNGKAFIIIPDGILNRINDKNLRKFIQEECFIEGIISLPTKTFFTTIKKTYVLILKKKNKVSDIQTHPVFTYVVSNIGETLDVYRFETPENNDLNEAVDLFNQFKGAKDSFKTKSNRCKIQPISKFNPDEHWSVDRWWSKKEKIKLGILEEEKGLDLIDFSSLLEEVSNSIKEYQEEIKELSEQKKGNIKKKLKRIKLDSQNYFTLGIGKRILKKDVRNSKGSVPVFSANVFFPIGYLNKSNIHDFKNDFILWGIDGDFDFNIKKAGEKFVSTDHCGTIEIKDKKINPEYLLYALYKVKDNYGFDRTLRASLKNMRNMEVEIPIDENGEFDLEKQKKIAKKYGLLNTIKLKIKNKKGEIKKISMDLSEEYKGKEMKIPSIFNINLGSSKYNHKYFSTHKGHYPVYSGQTKNNGEIAKIKTYEYDTEGLTWTIDGYAGRVFYRNGKFSLTCHCGLLTLKKEFEGILDYEFLKYLLDNELPNHSVGEGNKRLKKTHIEKISIKIPIDENGEFDLEKQKKIAKKYGLISEIKEELKKELNRVIETIADFD